MERGRGIEEVTEKEMMERFHKASENYLPSKTISMACRECSKDTMQEYSNHGVVEEKTPGLFGRDRKEYRIVSDYRCTVCNTVNHYDEALLRLDKRRSARKSKIIFC